MNENDIISIFSSGNSLIGDDCAVLNLVDRDLLISTDSFCDGTHFDLVFCSPVDVSYKVFHSSVSDVLAMGGRAKHCLLNISSPPNLAANHWLRKFCKSFLNLCDEYQIKVIGGDTTVSRSSLVISCSVMGESGPGKAIRRKKASKGDLICLSKPIGGSAAGLISLKSSRSYAGVNDYLRPTAEFEISKILAEHAGVSSMMDLTDGLFQDLGKLIPDHLYYQVDVARIPIPKYVEEFVGSMPSIEQEEFAVHAAEDLSLLFTINPSAIDQLRQRVSKVCGREIYVLGSVISSQESSGFLKTGERYLPKTKGFNHF